MEGITIFCALISASCSSSKAAVETEGMFAAKCRAVLPLMSTRFGSAWFSSRSLAQRSCWHCTAWFSDNDRNNRRWHNLRGKQLICILASEVWHRAGRSHSRLTFIKADLFWLSHRLSLALLSRRNCTTSACPLTHAKWSAVLERERRSFHYHSLQARFLFTLNIMSHIMSYIS